MSVEDIDYLLENSETDNFILYCDSAYRDRNYFPYPSHYQLTFDQPFKNVTGIEILDASIPSTMYNIETDANSIAGFTYALNKDITSKQTDYNVILQNYLKELSNFDEFDTAFNNITVASSYSQAANVENLNRITGQIIVSTFELIHAKYPSTSMTNPEWASDYTYDDIPLSTTAPYYLFRKGTILNSQIKRYIDDISIVPYNTGDINTDIGVYKFTFNGIIYAFADDPNDTVLQDYKQKIETYRYIITENTDGTIDLIYYQIDRVQQSVMLQITNNTPQILYLLIMTFFYSTVIAGNYSGVSFLTEAKRVMAGTNVTVAGSSSSDVSIQPKLKFSSSFPFVLNMNLSTLRSSIGFDEFSELSSKTYTKMYYKDNKYMFASNYDGGSETWNLTAAGVLYLLGTRYCILRCPEIEDHMYASLAYAKFSPGIGMFKMYAVNDIAHQRFDYVNFHRKPFHPIGKLDRLTFKFERADGTIYDFKGANHLILICIKYLVPSRKNKKFTRSILNPNYNYDFNSYMARGMEYKEPSDIDEGDEVDEQRVQMTQKKENEHDYSTSGDDEEDNDTSSDSEVDYRNQRFVRN
jgi:hypothetical protein